MKTVVVGKIGAPYGVKGWVKIHSFTEPKTNLFSYPLLIESKKEGWRQVEVEDFRQHGEGFVAKLVDVSDRDQAALITNAQLAVERESLPELEDDFYFADLLGLTVFNQENIELGRVADFMATGANDVMVVKGKKKEYLIPFILDMYILEISTENKTMRVDWDAEF